MSDAPYILEGTVENFERLVVENSKRGLVIVDFWAPWVGPSLKQRAILVDLAKRYQGRFLLVSINTDEQKPLVERFGVRSLPSFKLFHRGEMVAEYHGVQPEADYPRIIEQYVQRALDPTSREVIAAWQAGDPDRALQLLADAILADPENLELPALMGKILMRQQRYHDAHALLSALPEQAREAVEIRDLLAHLDIIVTAGDAETPERLMQRLQADPKDAESLYQLAALRLVGDELEEALDLLLELARSNPSYRDGIARRGMRAVLDKLDVGDEQVTRYRRELYRLDY
ncbi:MAG: tetratricopeptide repeat protein [Candidatus Thiodiazotropha sp.]|nr:tetratricopeptide repeat protein [Candidatus Thiodiazotropha sp. (ex Codakia orbicularis)]PUB74875.1 MAG: thioredoxin [gamma proteobacterium symbiont of Ctena orbiculata]PUB76838.1 MAG: thioredoxin [gamma proteobacterium symbiont of Ctena orbiculata]